MDPQSSSFIQAVFIVPPRVHLLDFTGPAHIFYEAASYGAPVRSVFSTMTLMQTEEVSSSSLHFQQLIPFDQLNLKEGDLIFIPGLEFALLSEKKFLTDSVPFQRWLKNQYANRVIICSVCTGAFLVAEAGLLDHRECTTHWKYTEQFKKAYPLAKLRSNRLFVEDRGIFSSAGVSSGIDLALYLVEQLWDAGFAAKIAKEVVIYFRRTIEDPQLSIYTQYRNHLDDRIHIVQDTLSNSLDHRFSIQELAEKVNMSVRNLSRSFKKATHITIGEYTDQLRTERAQKLVSEGHTFQAAALHCGLKSTNRLRSLLLNRVKTLD